MKGRKGLPTVVKELKGTLRADRVNKNEPKTIQMKALPKAPKFLGKVAKREFATIVNWLNENGLLEQVNLNLVTAYAIEVGRYFDCQDQVIDSLTDMTPNGMMVQSAYVGIANKALSNALKIAVEFGFTPASRSKVNATKLVDDPFEEFMKKKVS